LIYIHPEKQKEKRRPSYIHTHIYNDMQEAARTNKLEVLEITWSVYKEE